jgi:hypothetical protein
VVGRLPEVEFFLQVETRQSAALLSFQLGAAHQRTTQI